MKLILSLLCSLTLTSSFAGSVNIAVASNFTNVMKVICAKYERETGEKILLSFGSTGKLYAQVKNGAPYDAFFSADEERADLLVNEGLALKSSRFVYARGRIALFSLDLKVEKEAMVILQKGEFDFFAIANPSTAPYGSAAAEALKSLGVYQKIKKKIVYGENISQAFQFISTGNAKLGVVALSQLLDSKSSMFNKGEYYILKSSLHSPIDQAAVILKNTKRTKEINQFMMYLKSEKAQKIISNYGYFPIKQISE